MHPALTHGNHVASDVEMLPLAQFTVTVPGACVSSITRALTRAYPGVAMRALATPGIAAILAERGGRSVLIHVCPRGTGWLVTKGMIHDTRTGERADAAVVLAAIATERPDFDRFEGEFAAVVHDERRGITWAFNDQASLLHLYYGQAGDTHFITTAPLATARALGLRLDPAGVRELLGRGQLMCPYSLYTGMRKLGLGEHLRIEGGAVQLGRHWSPYHEPQRYSSKREAAEATASVLLAIARRYAALGPLVSDLSGGYDSRLVTCALSRAGARLTVTVNGHPQHPDVVLARRVANAAGWPVRHFGIIGDGDLTASMRREAAYMSRGELDAIRFYNHIHTRPLLARDHVAHVNGSGGELLRNFPWGQEFAGVGRRRPASVERVVRYRLLAERMLPDSLFVTGFQDLLLDDLRARVRAVVDDGAGTLTTQQLDAVYLLRLTGHIGAYNSSFFDLLPSGIPLMQRTMVEHAVSLPWTMRLSAGLLRRTIAILNPQAAAVETTYGGTAAPPNLATLPLELRQLFGRVLHLTDKVDRVALGGRIGRVVPLSHTDPAAPEPSFRTAEFREFLDPGRMHSRALYRPEQLATLLSDPETPMGVLSRIATFEHVCVELGVEPGEELLTA